MIRTTLKTMEKIKLQGICDFLRKIRRHVATNEVEHGIQKLCKLWSCKQKLSLKRKVMNIKLQMHTNVSRRLRQLLMKKIYFPLLSKNPNEYCTLNSSKGLSYLPPQQNSMSQFLQQHVRRRLIIYVQK